jgi:hypothetical protein
MVRAFSSHGHHKTGSLSRRSTADRRRSQSQGDVAWQSAVDSAPPSPVPIPEGVEREDSNSSAQAIDADARPLSAAQHRHSFSFGADSALNRFSGNRAANTTNSSAAPAVRAQHTGAAVTAAVAAATAGSAVSAAGAAPAAVAAVMTAVTIGASAGASAAVASSAEGAARKPAVSTAGTALGIFSSGSKSYYLALAAAAVLAVVTLQWVWRWLIGLGGAWIVLSVTNTLFPPVSSSSTTELKQQHSTGSAASAAAQSSADSRADIALSTARVELLDGRVVDGIYVAYRVCVTCTPTTTAAAAATTAGTQPQQQQQQQQPDRWELWKSYDDFAALRATLAAQSELLRNDEGELEGGGTSPLPLPLPALPVRRDSSVRRSSDPELLAERKVRDNTYIKYVFVHVCLQFFNCLLVYALCHITLY